MNSRWHLSNSPFAVNLSWIIAASCLLLSIAGVSWLYLQQRIEEGRALIAVEEEHHVQHQASMLQDDLRHIAYTLAYLREQIQLYGYGDSEINHVNFARNLYAFMQSNELYDQIRYIGSDGMELARVDYNRGEPVLVPTEKLQFKGDRDYFRQSMALDNNEIYISPLNQNMEHGKAELPYKSVIRFGLPIFSEKGEKVGVLILNQLADRMLNSFSEEISPTLAIPMLLNSEGYWLSHPDKKHQWGFMFGERHHDSMAVASAELWQQVIQKENGQFDFDGSMVTVATIAPFSSHTSMRNLFLSQDAAQRLWRIVSIYPKARLTEYFSPMKRRVVIVALFSMLVVIAMLLFWAGSRQKKQQLEVQLHLHARAMQESVVGIVIVDACREDYPIVYANRAFERMTGYEMAEMLGRNCRFLQEQDRNQLEVRKLAAALAKGVDCQAVVRNYRKDGGMFWNEVSISPVHDRDNHLTHFIGYHVDVSGRKISEHEREKLLEDLQQLSRQMIDLREEETSRIARALHDDVGQVLAAIQLQVGLTEQLCSKEDYTGAKQSIIRIKDMSESLSLVIRSQLRSIKPGHLEEIGLAAAVEELCRGWHEQLKLTLDIGELPENLSPKVALCLFRVVQEGLTNVIKHSGASEVEVVLKLENDVICLSCKDNGCGFDPVNVARGMGLTGMQERVRSLDGSILLDVDPGQGLCLNVCLPYTATSPETG